MDSSIAPDGRNQVALDELDPQSAESVLNEYMHDDWSEIEDSCPDCGNEDLEINELVFEPMEDTNQSYAPSPASVICLDCQMTLYEHPKWRVYKMFGEEYSYRQPDEV